MNKLTDHRLTQIHSWLDTLFPDQDYQLSPASADASFRRYFRLQQGNSSWIIMDAPPEHEDIIPFINIGRYLYQHGINVPQIFAIDYDHGFIRLADLGHTSFLSAVDDDNADQLYQAAIDIIIKMQLTPVAQNQLPAYERTLLLAEMDLFPQWFLQRHLQLPIPAFLTATFELLIDNAQAQPQLFVHRDYHSRNLMLNNEALGIIDFQDAVVGPMTYDLVSLLRDVYVQWPEKRVSSWLRYYHSQAQKAGLLADTTLNEFERWFDLMGLQRHLKILGIFCRLNYRDNKENYMNDLALTMNYVREISCKYPQLADLHDYICHQPTIAAI